MNAPRGKGDKYRVVPLSAEYGERRYAVEDLSVQRDNLVREWRAKGVGKVSVAGVKKPKTGLIWRGTKEQADALCKALNNASKLGRLSVAHDPPTRENARHWARARSTARTPSSPVTRVKSSAFAQCDTCRRMVRQPHEH